MTTKIKAEDLLKKLYAPGAKVEDFADYFIVAADEDAPFQLNITYDPDKVDLGATAEERQRAALALPGFNAMVRLLRRGQFELKLLGGYKGPILVAEGDSWFTFPRLDVIGALNDTWAISHLAAAGDTLQQMLAQDEYIDEVKRLRARLLLLSAGGNDALGGGDLKKHLRPYDPSLTPAQHIKSSFTALIDDAIQQFDQIYRRVAREAPGVGIICHGYDLAIPVTGKWLGKPMKALGITDKKVQRAIVAEMINRFALAMKRLADRYPHVTFLDNRGTVKDADWHDELHPNPAGFKKVAAKFDAAIRKATGRSVGGPPTPPKGPKGGKAKAPAPTRRKGLKVPTGLNRGMSLHIGLNVVDPGHYNGEQRLYGCHNDALAMARIAEEAGYEDRTVLLDGQATVKAVRDSIAAAAAKLKAGDIFLLTYAGHGASVPDFGGDETDDGRDETWCLFDRMLIDDEIYDGWRHFQEGVRVLVISDSCHSATILRAAVDGIIPTHSGAAGRSRSLSDDVRRSVISAHQATYRAAAMAVGAGEGGVLKPGRSRAITQPLDCTVRLLSGCMDNQTSGDGDLNGLFTSRLLQVLEGGFRGDYNGLHSAILKLMPESQTPNHWVVGRKDPAFDAQHPFEI